ncbi:alpha/beta-hydrolase, partial [Thozetella sp. PMI_491]
PAIIKTYPIRPTLTVRIHLPPDFELDSTHTFPLVYLIHGGGWVLGDASQDDEQAHLLAQAGYVTVSPNYHYGPSRRFPEPLEDCAAIFKAVLADASLRIDTSRVVVGGSSAGGNMSMALAQDPELRDQIHAVLQLQGLADWTGELRGPWRSVPWGGVDGLKHMIPVAEFAYVPPGEDLRNPLLSPRFATRDTISSPVFFMTSGAETIADEICDSARRLAGLEP